MISCDDVEIEALVFGGLTPEAAARARAHVASCERCRDEHAKLAHERRLFAERARRWSSELQWSEPLPSVEAIFSRAEKASPGLVRRAIGAALGEPGARRGARSHVVVAAAAGLLFIGLARSHPSPAVSSGAVGARSITAPHASSHGDVVDAKPDTCTEEAVCRDTRGLAFRIDPPMTTVVPREGSSARCTTEQASSSLSGVLSPPWADTPAMCVAGAS